MMLYCVWQRPALPSLELLGGMCVHVMHACFDTEHGMIILLFMSMYAGQPPHQPQGGHTQ
jgi:hypothetical protein